MCQGVLVNIVCIVRTGVFHLLFLGSENILASPDRFIIKFEAESFILEIRCEFKLC